MKKYSIIITALTCLLFVMLLTFCKKKDDQLLTPTHGDLTPYVGTWKGQTYYYCLGGYPMTLNIQSDGTVTGVVDIIVYSGGYYFPYTSNLAGEAWSERQPWHFSADLQESGATSSKMYLGGSLHNDTLSGWLSENNPVANPPDNCFLFALIKQ